MPNTITTYNIFAFDTTADETQVNTNFSNHRGTILPIDPTLAAASDQAYDIGTSEHRFKDGYVKPIYEIATKTATATLTASEQIILADATGGAFTITLPTATGDAGRWFDIKKISSNTNAITIATSDAETIDGATTVLMPSKENKIKVVSDGTGWQSVIREIPIIELRQDTGGDSANNNIQISVDTLVKSTHGALDSNGTFVAPIDGELKVRVDYLLDDVSAANATQYSGISFKLNGNEYKRTLIKARTTSSVGPNIGGEAMIPIVFGDSVSCYFFENYTNALVRASSILYNTIDCTMKG